MWLKLVLLIMLSFQHCHSFSNGAGTPACSSMIPQHPPNNPLTTSSPVTISVSTNNVQHGQMVTLTIQGNGGFEYRGFMVQARTAGGAVVGRFLVTDGLMRNLDCLGLPTDSVITHTSPILKPSMSFSWQAQTDFVGAIHFQ